MNKTEAEIIILKDLIISAYHHIQFLEGCITQPNDYEYSYPEQTQKFQERLKEYVPDMFCYHSMIVRECTQCMNRCDYMFQINEAKKVLSSK